MRERALFDATNAGLAGGSRQLALTRPGRRSPGEQRNRVQLGQASSRRPLTVGFQGFEVLRPKPRSTGAPPPSISAAISRLALRSRARSSRQQQPSVAVVGEPGAPTFPPRRPSRRSSISTDLGDALAVHDVELDLAERRGHLVLDHLYPVGVAHHDLVAVLDHGAARCPGAPGSTNFNAMPVSSRTGNRTSPRSSCRSG